MKLRIPDFVGCYGDTQREETNRVENEVSLKNGAIRFVVRNDQMNVFVCGKEDPIRYVRLRWNEPMRKDVKILGDTYERDYGEMMWSPIFPERVYPWYLIASNGSDRNLDTSDRKTECFGVGISPSAFCMFQYDCQGLTLWLDLRNGGCGTDLNGRELLACSVFFRDYEKQSAFASLQSFCKVLSMGKTLPVKEPVYGSNNWYYAYGHSSAKEIIDDSRFVKSLCQNAKCNPYMVIDDGWQENPCDAPWDHGNERFPDMKNLADEMKKIGVKPGIWVRYLINGRDDEPRKINLPEEWYSQRNKNCLDPSHPEVLTYVADTTKRIVSWGFELIKHDFSTFDAFGDYCLLSPNEIGRWKCEGAGLITAKKWHFYDTKKTNAEIMKTFFQTILENAQDAVVIGCNTISHLCAEYSHLNRIGDDTSGYDWSRTTQMGVNCLAFRLAQHNAFYKVDADCVGIIKDQIPWEQNRKWLNLLAHSGTPLFVSCQPWILSEEQAKELSDAFTASSTQKDVLIPLDWMETTCPEEYLLNGEKLKISWYEEKGNNAFHPEYN